MNGTIAAPWAKANKIDKDKIKKTNGIIHHSPFSHKNESSSLAINNRSKNLDITFTFPN